jgi:hypothetical protein
MDCLAHDPHSCVSANCLAHDPHSCVSASCSFRLWVACHHGLGGSSRIRNCWAHRDHALVSLAVVSRLGFLFCGADRSKQKGAPGLGDA